MKVSDKTEAIAHTHHLLQRQHLATIDRRES